MKVLIVEDEVEVRNLLQSVLTPTFELSFLENGLDIVPRITDFKPDVVLLDQMLPGKSGADCVREVRARREFARVPIIMVTGVSGEEEKVAALELGADDYVTKPFLPRELVARIRAVHRRVSDEPLITRIKAGDLEVDTLAHRVVLEGSEVALTLTEFNILRELMKKAGHVLSREKLRELALGNLNVTDRTIDVHMASLRKKLNPLADKIETVRGVGYRFGMAASLS